MILGRDEMVIGRIARSDLADLERSGLTPKQAVDAILAEAKVRHPKAVSVHIVKANMHEGFDIVAM